MDSTANEQLEKKQASLPRFKMIYLSKNMAGYTGAHYQQDVIEEMDRQHEVFFYGPGFPLYDPEDEIEDVISKAPFSKPDLICVGHSWLGDDLAKGIHIHQDLNLQNTQIPKAIFLNKEYVLLKEKIGFINENRIEFVFSHHHRIREFTKDFKFQSIFLPFAADPERFRDQKLPKDYDLVFTGMIINGEHPMQPFRLMVQKKLFNSLGEIRFSPKRKYRNMRFFWQSVPSTPNLKKLNSIIHKEKWLNNTQYSELLNRSRVCLNSPSTLDIISPRYFECMMSKCLVLCQKSEANEGIFLNGHNCLTVRSDLSNFDDQLRIALDDAQSSTIIEQAYLESRQMHTWKNRIKQFTYQIAK